MGYMEDKFEDKDLDAWAKLYQVGPYLPKEVDNGWQTKCKVEVSKEHQGNHDDLVIPKGDGADPLEVVMNENIPYCPGEENYEYDDRINNK